MDKQERMEQRLDDIVRNGEIARQREAEDAGFEKPEDTHEAIITLIIDGAEVVRKFHFFKYSDSTEYVKTKLSEVAYDMTQEVLKDIRNF